MHACAPGKIRVFVIGARGERVEVYAVVRWSNGAIKMSPAVGLVILSAV